MEFFKNAVKKYTDTSLILRIVIGLVIGVAGWVLLFNRRAKPDEAEQQEAPETEHEDSNNKE